MTSGSRVLSRDELRQLGADAARALMARRGQILEAVCSTLSFPLSDMEREFARTVNLLHRLETLSEVLEAREPLCDSGDDVRVLLPYNLGPIALGMIISAAATGNPVRVRFSSRARELGELCSEVVRKVSTTCDVSFERSGGEEFVDRALKDPRCRALVAYGGESLGWRLLNTFTTTRIIFEGPGKDPMIVGSSTTPEELTRVLRGSKFARSGQECIATERLVLPPHRQDLVEAVAEMTSSVRADPEWSPEIEVTSLASSVVPSVIKNQLTQACQLGARILTGGGIRNDFVEPTLVVDVPLESSLWLDETFGPVIAVPRRVPGVSSIGAALLGRFGLHGIVLGDDEEVEDALRHRVEPEEARLSFNRIGVVSWGRQFFTEPEDDFRPFGGWGISGWVREPNGRVHQGPRVMAHELTRPKRI